MKNLFKNRYYLATYLKTLILEIIFSFSNKKNKNYQLFLLRKIKKILLP
jgi:hypothetical protein